MRWCGAGNSTNAIQLNRPTSNALSEMKSTLAAAIRPSLQPEAAHRRDREILEDDAERKSENVVAGRGAAPVASATLHAALQLPRRLMFLVAGSEEPPLAVKTPRRASATMISKGRSA